MIAIIPARGGSKRIPKKNIRLFHGKPIIQYSIDAAKESGLFSKIVVSTDSEEIAEIVKGNNRDVDIHWRSELLSGDDPGTQAVAKEVLLSEGVRHGVACVIYPCAPMLSAETLISARKELAKKIDSNCYAVPVGEWLSDPGQFYMGLTGGFIQELPLLSEWTMIFPVDPKTCCDINTEEDWKKAEKMYEELNK